MTETAGHTMHKPYGPYEKYFKRLLDVVCGIAIVVLLWWLYLIIAILVYFKLGKPVLFVQERPGKNGKLFRCKKFRTMTNETDRDGNFLSDENRLPAFGKLLRSTSLDELPEVFNIIRGEMSFVGPRPLLAKYLPYYTEKEMHRHDIRPGLTGLAQISGRNYLNWEERFALDLKYVEHVTFTGDARILFRTVMSVVRRKDILERDDAVKIKNLSFQDLDVERKNKY